MNFIEIIASFDTLINQLNESSLMIKSKLETLSEPIDNFIKLPQSTVSDTNMIEALTDINKRLMIILENYNTINKH